jgi:hypothetical protein
VYPTTSAQEERFRTAGWPAVHACNMATFFDKLLSAEER